MYITTFQELKDYIFRQLGGEQYRIEISDNNFLDIYNTTLKYMYDYVSDAVTEQILLVQLNGERQYQLADNIVSVFEFNTSTSPLGGSNIAYRGTSPLYDFFMMNTPQTSAYVVYTDQMRDLRNIFRKQVYFRFNAESKILTIDEEIKDTVMLKIFEAEDVSKLYDMRIFKLVLERDAWNIWATNTGAKYIGAKVGNGNEINSEYMMNKYKELDDKIKESMDNEEFDFLAPFKLN